MMPKWPCHSFVPRGFVDQAPARVTGGQPRAAAVVIYCVAFLTGAIVMSFEMLGSRYLSPYFGGGIYTWAALISTVLIALTAGYFVGGILADRTISASVLGLIVIAGSGYLLVLPSFAQPVLEFALDSINDIRAGSLIASLSLMLVPVTFFGMCSPFAVRLLLRSAKSSGRVAGAVYGIFDGRFDRRHAGDHILSDSGNRLAGNHAGFGSGRAVRRTGDACRVGPRPCHLGYGSRSPPRAAGAIWSRARGYRRVRPRCHGYTRRRPNCSPGNPIQPRLHHQTAKPTDHVVPGQGWDYTESVTNLLDADDLPLRYTQVMTAVPPIRKT